MKLTVTSEYHCVADEGEIWSVDRGTYAAQSKFLDVFDEVTVFCRVGPGKRSDVMQKVTGDGVSIVAVPDFDDPRSFLRVAGGTMAVARVAASAQGAFLLHAPGTMASLLGSQLRRRRRTFGIEVVGDPGESLAGATVASKVIASLASRQLRRLSSEACASRYVTEWVLQEHYPPAAGSPTFVASDVDVPDSVFLEPVPTTRPGPVLELGFVGMLHRPYKGLDVLFDALCQTRHPHRLGILGDGTLRGDLAARAAAQGLGDRVTFLGAVPTGEPVRAFLATIDLFVQPSRTEGLPRALIEAMATGLPCLATPVGGVPEMLDGYALVPVDDSGALARAIDALAVDPPLRAAHAERNRMKTRGYAQSTMDELNRSFRAAIRDTTVP